MSNDENNEKFKIRLKRDQIDFHYHLPVDLLNSNNNKFFYDLRCSKRNENEKFEKKNLSKLFIKSSN